jgi:hypothetical protein
MRVKFLVVLAVICLYEYYVSASVIGWNDKVKQTEKLQVHFKTTKKEVKKKPPKLIPCSEAVMANKISCETEDIPPGYKGIFTYKDNTDCDWECNYQALPSPLPKPKRNETN